jgi:hypothetical protein
MINHADDNFQRCYSVSYHKESSEASDAMNHVIQQKIHMSDYKVQDSCSIYIYIRLHLKN